MVLRPPGLQRSTPTSSSKHLRSDFFIFKDSSGSNGLGLDSSAQLAVARVIGLLLGHRGGKSLDNPLNGQP